jgi:hypothetical protein
MRVLCRVMSISAVIRHVSRDGEVTLLLHAVPENLKALETASQFYYIWGHVSCGLTMPSTLHMIPLERPVIRLLRSTHVIVPNRQVGERENYGNSAIPARRRFQTL